MASRMFRETLSIFSLLIITWFTAGCSLLEPAPTTPASMAAVSQVFTGNYDEVWRAIQKALVSYPIQINNSDQGIIETDVIKGDQVWQPPFKKKAEKRNIRYALRVNAIKGRVQNKNSVRVAISKNMSLEKDFFS